MSESPSTTETKSPAAPAPAGDGKASAAKERKVPQMLSRVILVTLLSVAVIVGGWFLYDTLTWVSTDDAVIDGNHVTLSAKMLGRISRLLVNEREKVTIGQPLAELDAADLRAQEQQVASSLKSAEQNLLLAGVNRDRALDDFQRSKTLYASGAQTREQYGHASKALDTANAQYNIAQAQIDTARAQLGVIETQLSNTVLTAPIDGVIAKRFFQTGDVVQPSQAIFTINDLGTLWVTANFEETKIRHIQPGALVKVSVDAYPSLDARGTVTYIAAGIVAPPFAIGDFTKTTQRIPVKIELHNVPTNLVLLPGMSVEVKVHK